jgi:peptidoglycan hydrolase-like protein with peptidoglycan-binding domain
MRLAVWLLLLMTIALPNAARADAPARLTRAANLYARPAASASILAALPKGELLIVRATSGAWCKVLYKGKVGYVARKSLSRRSAKRLYATQSLTLSASRSASGEALCQAGAGAAVYALGAKGDWVQALYNGYSGYAPRALLSARKPSAPEPTPTPTPTPKPTATLKPTPTPSPASGGYATLKPGDSGAAVKKLQTRLKALGWYTGAIGGHYQSRTTQAVKDFQGAAGLEANGTATGETQSALYASNAPRRDDSGESTATPATGKVYGMDWWTSDIQKIFYKGRTVVVTDVRTGLSWREVRVGGTNHADCAPLTAKDTAALKAAYGGKWSWDRRPIWVSIGGVRYAASMNGMPHGGDSIDNGFPGHHCIHFINSRTHGTNRVDPDHQAAIQEALAAQ